MRGAIVGFSKQKQIWPCRRRIKTETLCLPIGEKTCRLFLLPCTEEEFAQLPLKRQSGLLKRLVRQLEKSDITCVYAVGQLQERLAGNFYMPDGRRIFCAVAGHIIERHCKTFSLTAENTRVCIYENPFTEAGYVAAEQMVMRTKQLVLVSPDTAGAACAAKALFEEYGLAAQVTDNVRQMNKANLVLLLSVPPQEVLSTGLILDFKGNYPHRAHKDYYFETVFGYAEFFRYFGKADCRAAEFVLLCCGAEAEDVLSALLKIGWRTKKA